MGLKILFIKYIMIYNIVCNIKYLFSIFCLKVNYTDQCIVYRQLLFDSGISSSHNKAITLLLDSQERVLPQDLVIGENESVRKVISMLVFLCDEVYQLRDIAEGR